MFMPEIRAARDSPERVNVTTESFVRVEMLLPGQGPEMIPIRIPALIPVPAREFII